MGRRGPTFSSSLLAAVTRDRRCSCSAEDSACMRTRSNSALVAAWGTWVLYVCVGGGGG
jgi:hypothetical protein